MSTTKLMLTALFTLVSAMYMGQSLTMNQIKYWEYRERLKEEFMVIGSGPGKSIPAESVHADKSEAHFSDATLHLAWYIATLCTEYQLSAKNAYLRTGEGKEIKKEQTLLELYYALQTLERLDKVAEPFYDKEAAPQLNGFFIRDDIPKGFEKGIGLKNAKGDSSQEDIYNNEMSQDQVIHILMSIMFVKEFIPEGTKVKGVDLRQTAIDQGLRILAFMKTHGWHIVNPVVMKNKRSFKRVKRGSQAFIYSHGFNKLLKQLSDGEENYGNKVSILNKIFWGSMRSKLNPTYFSNDNRHLSLALIASGNGFKRNTYRKLMKRSKKHDWYAYPMMNLLLNPENRTFKKEKKSGMTEVQAILDRAPSAGPTCPYPNRNEDGWGCQNMFLRDVEYQRTGRYFHEGKTFNGLDYMLMYNLFMMHRSGLFMN